jgi:hypothetical protein
MWLTQTAVTWKQILQFRDWWVVVIRERVWENWVTNCKTVTNLCFWRQQKLKKKKIYCIPTDCCVAVCTEFYSTNTGYTAAVAWNRFSSTSGTADTCTYTQTMRVYRGHGGCNKYQNYNWKCCLERSTCRYMYTRLYGVASCRLYLALTADLATVFTTVHCQRSEND